MPDKVRRAIDGLGDLVDGYEFHHPNELSDENLDEVRAALGDHDIYCIASGLHLDHALRPRRARLARRRGAQARGGAHDRGGRLRRPARRALHHLARDRGLQLPVPDALPESWRWLVEGIAEAAQVCAGHGVKLFLEHKNSEPAMKIHMGNIGMTLHIIHKLRAQGFDNVQVNMDWQHLIMNGENLAEYVGAAGRRGPARPPARELGLGDVRRRQHGRRDGVHGDDRARARAAPGGLRPRRRPAPARAWTSTRTPRTRSAP